MKSAVIEGDVPGLVAEHAVESYKGWAPVLVTLGKFPILQAQLLKLTTIQGPVRNQMLVSLRGGGGELGN
jgi:hypothetical protein